MTRPPITKEERDDRLQLAKALWHTETAASRPRGGQEAQAAFDAVRQEMLGKAIKLEKTLSRLGYGVKRVP